MADELFAWIGEDEFGSGEVGLKQAVVPAGYIPLVSMKRDGIERPVVLQQLQHQADTHGKTIRLARYVRVEDLVTIIPRGGTK